MQETRMLYPHRSILYLRTSLLMPRRNPCFRSGKKRFGEMVMQAALMQLIGMVPAIKSGMRFAGGSVTEGWPISTDPDAHVKAISELFESGATEVHIHSGQPNQKRVIEFYGKQVLPRLKFWQGSLAPPELLRLGCFFEAKI